MRRRATDIVQAAGTAGAGAINLAQLDRATFGDRALRREVLSLFQRQAVVLAAEVADAPTDAARSEAAHKLRGAALGVGANAVARAAAALEPFSGNAIDLANAVADLSARVAEARAVVAGLLSGD